jgi:hypothetical protein
VEWKGFEHTSEPTTWEHTDNVRNCPRLLRTFHETYPDKPGPF